MLYTTLPNQNPTADAYAYAASVRWETDLWKPHHLLYNATGWAFTKLLSTIGFHTSALPSMQLLNSIFAVASLWVLFRILKRIQSNPWVITGFLLVAGASFGPMRYATENETYLIPIFFSLLGSLFWVKYSQHQSTSHLLLSGFWAAFACLFHQIHFFWWLGLGLSLVWVPRAKPWTWFWYFVPALVVPLGYGLVMGHLGIPFGQTLQFVFQDFYKASVQTTISGQNFLMTGISLVRTFMEVHGRLYFLFLQHWLWLVPGLMAFALIVWGVLTMVARIRKSIVVQPLVLKSHVLVLLLQLLFAWYAVGNAEFMVMFPFLVVLVLASFQEWRPKTGIALGLGLLLWNTTYGLVPNHFHRYTNHACLYQTMQKKPAQVLLLQDKTHFNAYYHYKTGQPFPMAYETWDRPARLDSVISQAIAQNQIIYTDYSTDAPVFSRARLLLNSPSDALFKKYMLLEVASCPTLFGDKKLFRVTVTSR